MPASRPASSIIAIGALALVIFLPSAKGPVFRVSPLKAGTEDEKPVTSDNRPVRVVYAPSAVSLPHPADVAEAEAYAPAAAPSGSGTSEDEQLPRSRESSAGQVTQANIDAVLQSVGRININTASVDDLDQIPGAGRIGRAIIRSRPYASVDELLTRRVLRRSTFDRIKDEVEAD